MKKLIALFMAAAMLALPASALGSARSTKGNAIGMSILGFVTHDANDARVDDSILSNAAITVFNFWASWCGPCVGELPEFNMLYNNYNATPEADVQLIGVMVDSSDYADAVNYVSTHGYNWKQLYMCSKFSEILNTTATGTGISIPQTIIVDYRGEVLDHKVGSFSNYNQLYNFVLGKLQYVMNHYPPAFGELGDADGNGQINSNDALAILRMSLGLIPTGSLSVVDIDGNGTVNANDALLLFRRLLGLRS